jgi:dsRNA-specific ribonuclease
MAIGNRVYSLYPDANEGALTKLREKRINNKKLCETAFATGMTRYLRAEPLAKGEINAVNTCPPGMCDAAFLEERSVWSTDVLKSRKEKKFDPAKLFLFPGGPQHTTAAVKFKKIADMVEAIIGAYYLDGGVYGGIAAIKAFNIWPQKQENKGTIAIPLSLSGPAAASNATEFSTVRFQSSSPSHQGKRGPPNEKNRAFHLIFGLMVPKKHNPSANANFSGESYTPLCEQPSYVHYLTSKLSQSEQRLQDFWCICADYAGEKLKCWSHKAARSESSIANGFDQFGSLTTSLLNSRTNCRSSIQGRTSTDALSHTDMLKSSGNEIKLLLPKLSNCFVPGRNGVTAVCETESETSITLQCASSKSKRVEVEEMEDGEILESEEDAGQIQQMDQKRDLNMLEKKLGYSFKDKKLLNLALAHSSLQGTNINSYERLEFLGDGVMDCVLITYWFRKDPLLEPCGLHDKKSYNTTNRSLSAVAYFLSLHDYIDHQSQGLQNNLDQYCAAISEYLKDKTTLAGVSSARFSSGEKNGAESIIMPDIGEDFDKSCNVLADAFEAIVGAIYLDSGRDLDVITKFAIRCGIIKPLVQ